MPLSVSIGPGAIGAVPPRQHAFICLFRPHTHLNTPMTSYVHLASDARRLWPGDGACPQQRQYSEIIASFRHSAQDAPPMHALIFRSSACVPPACPATAASVHGHQLLWSRPLRTCSFPLATVSVFQPLGSRLRLGDRRLPPPPVIFTPQRPRHHGHSQSRKHGRASCATGPQTASRKAR